MSNARPLVSVIIAHRTGEPPRRLLSVLRRIRSVSLEVLTVSGNLPSYQRNQGVAQARGRYVYFLDDDAIPGEENFILGPKLFARDKRIACVGGPSLTPRGDSLLQQVFGHVLGSFWGTAFVHTRYRSKGEVRPTSDRELILCNLWFRTRAFQAVGGFNEALYPNEENELLDRIRSAGGLLYHHPRMTVERSQRPGWRAFIHQLLGYGRGRAEQMRQSFRIGNLPMFAFLVLPLYLPAAPFLTLVRPWLGLPLACYAALLLVASCGSIRLGWKAFPRAVLAFLFCHVCYGLGMWRGLLFRLKSKDVKPVARVRRVFSRGC